MVWNVWPARNAGNWHFLIQRTILAMLSMAWKKFLLGSRQENKDRGNGEEDHLEAQHKGQSGPSGRTEHSHRMERHTAQQVSMTCRRRPLYSHASPWLGGSSHLAGNTFTWCS